MLLRDFKFLTLKKVFQDNNSHEKLFDKKDFAVLIPIYKLQHFYEIVFTPTLPFNTSVNLRFTLQVK